MCFVCNRSAQQSLRGTDLELFVELPKMRQDFSKKIKEYTWISEKERESVQRDIEYGIALLENIHFYMRVCAKKGSHLPGNAYLEMMNKFRYFVSKSILGNDLWRRCEQHFRPTIKPKKKKASSKKHNI